MSDPKAEETDGLDRPSLARSSVARLLSEVGALLLGLFGGIITARLLGPAGKGAYASLTFLLGIFSQLATLGLGDVAVILIGQKRASLQEAVAASIGAILAASAVGAVALAAVAALAVGGRGPTLGDSIIVLALTVPVRACVVSLTFFVNAREKIVATSIFRSIGNVVTVVALVMLVIVIPLNITGAVLAVLVASSVELLLVTVMLRKMGVSLRPVWDLRFLRVALRQGPVIQIAYLVVTLASRIDVLVVYWLAGRAQAGYYSVALTLGQLVIYVSFSMAFASYPRLAYVSDTEAAWLVAKISRIGLAASVVVASALMLLIPFILPLFFGEAYRPSIGPALLLVVGGLVWSELWLLSRAAVARGNTGLQLRSFAATLTLMLALDFLLVPQLGIMGAALASVAGPGVGLLICIRAYRKSGLGELTIRNLFPHIEDFRELFLFVMTLPTRAAASVRRS